MTDETAPTSATSLWPSTGCSSNRSFRECDAIFAVTVTDPYLRPRAAYARPSSSFSKNNPFGDPSSCWDFFRREEMTRAMERNFVSHRGMKHLVPFDPLNAHRSKVRFKEIELKIKKGKFSFVSFVIGKIIIYISSIKYLRNFFFSLGES